MRRPSIFLATGLAASVAAAVLAGGAPAATETFTEHVEFASQHPCTLEPVVGETRVHVVITTTETRIRVLQQTHGQTLVGAVSGDDYVFNNAEDVVTEADLVGGSARLVIRTEFIHQGEGVAFGEEQGLDDFHQRLVVTVTPGLPPTIERDRADCR